MLIPLFFIVLSTLFNINLYYIFHGLSASTLMVVCRAIRKCKNYRSILIWLFVIFSRMATTIFLYGARLFISVADLAGYVYTPEVRQHHTS